MWASEWGVTSILDLLEGSGSREYQYDQEEGPEDDSSESHESHMMSGCITHTTDTTTTRVQATRTRQNDSVP